MKFSCAPSVVTALEAPILLIISCAVTFFLFAASFNGVSARVAAGPSNGNNPAIPKPGLGAADDYDDGAFATVQDAFLQSEASRPLVEKINAVRRIAGLQTVELDEALNRACRFHAQYLATNRANPQAQGMNAHVEREELPGYTAEGNKAAMVSNIFWGRDIDEVVDLWMGTLYHRIPLLRPNLKRIGLGHEAGIVVLDVLSGLAGSDLDLVAYPADGQANVPTEFGFDVPDPLPKGAPRKAGYPITLGFSLRAKIDGVEADLIDSDGAKVEFHLSDPQRPATSFPQQSTICLIPARPLATNTTYKVSIKANVDGREVRKSWSFITRKTPAPK